MTDKKKSKNQGPVPPYAVPPKTQFSSTKTTTGSRASQDFKKFFNEFSDEAQFKELGEALQELIKTTSQLAYQGIHAVNSLAKDAAEAISSAETKSPQTSPFSQFARVGTPQPLDLIRDSSCVNRKALRKYGEKKKERRDFFITFTVIQGFLWGTGIIDNFIMPVTIAATALAATLSHILFQPLRDRRQRIQRYLSIMGNSRVISVFELAELSHKTPDMVQKDLIEAIETGIFLQGRLVEKGQLFIADKQTYLLYKDFVQQGRPEDGDQRFYLGDTQLSEIDEFETESAELSQDSDLSKETRELIEKNQAYCKRFNAYLKISNDNIKDRLVSLVEKMNTIGQLIPKNQYSAEILKHYFNYYLPSLESFLKKYQEFDDLQLKTSHQEELLNSIYETLEQLNTAFSSLIESLSFDGVNEVKSDILVLQTKLKQEGLLGKDFTLNKK